MGAKGVDRLSGEESISIMRRLRWPHTTAGNVSSDEPWTLSPSKRRVDTLDVCGEVESKKWGEVWGDHEKN